MMTKGVVNVPIKIPNDLPAVETLREENIFVMTESRAVSQDIRPLKILFLNLMPTKIATETQFCRLFSNTPIQIELELLHTSSHESKNVPPEHILSFYKTFDQVRENNYDGLIITGAPVELMEFEEVEYWDELKEILEWSRSHVTSTVHVCWGAQAALYYHYGIKKVKLPKKLSGVYLHRKDDVKNELLRGMDDEFYIPHSRNTTVLREDIEGTNVLNILAESDEAGVFAAETGDGREIYIMGHPEYDTETLNNEFIRDMNAGHNPDIPVNYYPDDDYNRAPVNRWRSQASLIYINWINYVYQTTPYDLNDIGRY